MDQQLLWTIAGLGAIALGGVFWRMHGGFGPYNLRAFGIVFVGTITGLLALHDSGSHTSAMGILGAIAGYLFGLREAPASKTGRSTH